jgi:peroxiredoxin
MFHRLIAAAGFAIVWGSACTSAALAGKFNKALDIGDKAPGFEAIIGIDGKNHSLRDYQRAKVVVICFTCNHCPIAVAYENRFLRFTSQYKDKGVEFVAINVNNIEADKLDKMRSRAIKKGFNFDYLYDSSQSVGRAYGATVTPHLFVLGQDRKIAYMGPFDNSLNPNNVTHNYVPDAVDSLLLGQSVTVAEAKQFGCAIEYERTTKKADRSKAAKETVVLRTVDKSGFEKVVKQHRGKVVFVDFWGTWCINCLKRFPHTIALHRQYQKDGLRVISVALEFEPTETKDKVLDQLKKQKATFDNLLSDEPLEDAIETFNIKGGGLPEYWLLGRDGKLIRKFTNEDPDHPIEHKDIEKAIRAALGLKQQEPEKAQ